MKAAPAWLLKLCAGLLTGLAAAGSTAYVTGHLKTGAAPLHPAVVSGSSSIFSRLGLVTAPPPRASSSGAGGHLHLSPSVETTTSQQPITITSVS